MGLRPLPGPVPDPAGAYDLAKLGYTEQEFLLTGSATSYRLAAERTPDGRWNVLPAGPAQFSTRVVVRQPADADDFSGTVVVEWLNVSGGLDAAPDWMLTHTHLDAQRACLGGRLRPACRDRGRRPGREPAPEEGAPGPLRDRCHIPVTPGRSTSSARPGMRCGASRGCCRRRSAPGRSGCWPAATPSRGRSWSPTSTRSIRWRGVYDGFLVHGRTGAGAALDTGFNPGASTDGIGEQIRADLRVPVIVLQSETDVTLLGSGRANQDDGELLRNWEVAGAAHADTYLLFASGQDDGSLPPARLAELMRPTTDILMGRTESPINSGPQHHYVECAAIEHLDAWVTGRSAPPAAARLNLSADGQDFARDELGIATGGIRTPWTDVPVAILSGTGQRGELFAFLFGTTRKLGPADLARLYPGGQADYLGRFELSLDTAIKTGFLLAADRTEILAVAAASWPGP